MPSTVRQNEEVSRRIRRDMVDFYENMAQAYYLLGFEYYKLYDQAVNAKDVEAAKQYYHNARLYKQYYQDLMDSVNVMRESFGMPKREDRMSTATVSPTVLPSTDFTTSRTEVISVEPAGQKASAGEQPAAEAVTSPTVSAEPKPSFWERLRLRGKKSETK